MAMAAHAATSQATAFGRATFMAAHAEHTTTLGSDFHPGGHRVRIQDAGAGGGSCSRGWHILRSQWREFCSKRGDVPTSVCMDLEAPTVWAKRPAGPDHSKDSFDRDVDLITSHYTSDSPRSKAGLAIWQRAADSNNDLRVLLADPWSYVRRDDEDRSPASQATEPAAAFFPQEWSNCLTEDTLADLIVDAFCGEFCDAFLDGAISLVEVANKMNTTQSVSNRSMSMTELEQSMSATSLSRPSANRRLRNTSHTDKALLSMTQDEDWCAPSGGFTMSGLTKDPWDAWNSTNIHKCKPLDPFVKRIARATEIQRPQRRMVKPSGSSPDLRRFVVPMAATHFPEAWDRKPKPIAKRRQSMQMEPVESTADAEEKWLLKVDKSGKTTFPYSLVSHRAFLNSQSDPILKEKALKLAPLRFTDTF